MMRCRLREDKADIEFAHYWLQSSVVREHVRHRAKGTSPTMKKISQGDVQEMPFPLVSLDAQRAMAKQLRLVQEMVDAMAGLQAQTSAELDDFLASVLHKAFHPELQ